MPSGDRLKTVWRNMLQRCYRTSGKNYHYYAERGIGVCSEWRNYESFRAWAIESGYDYDAAYGECTLDRIDVNGDYTPDNCRWVDIATQNKNRRPYTTSKEHHKRIPPEAGQHMTTNELVSHRLYDWMVSCGATLVSVARAIGISPNSLAKKIQCTSKWRYDEVIAVSELTGCSLNEFAGMS